MGGGEIGDGESIWGKAALVGSGDGEGIDSESILCDAQNSMNFFSDEVRRFAVAGGLVDERYSSYFTNDVSVKSFGKVWEETGKESCWSAKLKKTRKSER